VVNKAAPFINEIGQILDNRILLVAIAACLIAQAIKLTIDTIQNGKISVKVLTTTGGMPSAHSALVTALAAGVGEDLGWKSAEFAIATIVAVVVMYDAAGVRQAAGKQARILNQMVDELFSDDHKFNEEKLKELLGHTPVQVIAGSILGIAITWLFAAIG
jgi:uncharacterized protein